MDFTRADGNVRINMVFVRPAFRHRGIGSALARYVTAQHPGATITCASPTWTSLQPQIGNSMPSRACVCDLQDAGLERYAAWLAARRDLAESEQAPPRT
ncbi:MAG TPA: GNAT family N-acetyltransferase [Telluria sp.]